MLLVVAGVLALLAGALAGAGPTRGDVVASVVGFGAAVAVVAALATSDLRRRLATARIADPAAVRIRQAPRHLLLLRSAAAILFLVGVSLLLAGWFGDGLPVGVLWVAMGVGAGYEARATRGREREHGGTLVAVVTRRRPWSARVRRPFPPVESLLLRRRVDVTLDDHEPDGEAPGGDRRREDLDG